MFKRRKNSLELLGSSVKHLPVDTLVKALNFVHAIDLKNLSCNEARLIKSVGKDAKDNLFHASSYKDFKCSKLPKKISASNFMHPTFGQLSTFLANGELCLECFDKIRFDYSVSINYFINASFVVKTFEENLPSSFNNVSELNDFTENYYAYQQSLQFLHNMRFFHLNHANNYSLIPSVILKKEIIEVLKLWHESLIKNNYELFNEIFKIKEEEVSSSEENFLVYHIISYNYENFQNAIKIEDKTLALMFSLNALSYLPEEFLTDKKVLKSLKYLKLDGMKENITLKAKVLKPLTEVEFEVFEVLYKSFDHDSSNLPNDFQELLDTSILLER